MPRVCALSGKKTTIGRTYTHRGMAKYKGGVGTKITGITARTFKPNLQTVRAMVDGRPVKIKVAAKFIRRNMIVKPPLKRRKDKAARAYHG